LHGFDRAAECVGQTNRQTDKQTDAQAMAKTREAYIARKNYSPNQNDINNKTYQK